jgi:beta-carotene hydroxylase
MAGATMSHARESGTSTAYRDVSRRRSKVALFAAPGEENASDELKRMAIADGRLHLLYGLPYLLSYFGCAALILWTQSSILKIALGLVMGNQLYLLFILHHDCVHFSACRSRQANVLLGRLYALFLVKTFTATLETHKRHHAFLGEQGKDPDDHFFAGGIRWVWVRYWQNFSWHTYLSLTQYGPKVRRTVLLEQALNVAFWICVHLVLYRFGMLRDALFVFWLPAATIILLVGPVTRSYEHLPLAHYSPEDPRRFDIAFNTVTVTNRLLGLFWANITYHVEHHSYSRIPFYRLHRAHALLQAHGDTSYLVAPYTLYGVFQGESVIDKMDVRRRSARRERSKSG